MTTKTSKKSLTDALAQNNVVDIIRHATTKGELEIMKKHIQSNKENGADIYNMMAGKLPMVLHLIQGNRLKSIKILADLGLNLNATDNRNNNALHYSAQKDNKYVSFFIQQGVDVHHRNRIGCQPLALTCSHASIVNPSLNARVSNLKSMIDAGANINDINPVEGDYKGRAALSWVLSPEPNMLPVLDFLMRQPNLEIHNVNGEGDSALHLAVARGNLEMTQYLIDTGRFDLDQVNGQGFTALDVARRNITYYGVEEVIAYLTPIYAAWAEKKELTSLLSLTAKEMESAMGIEATAAGDLSAFSDASARSKAVGLTQTPTTRPSPKTRSL